MTSKEYYNSTYLIQTKTGAFVGLVLFIGALIILFQIKANPNNWEYIIYVFYFLLFFVIVACKYEVLLTDTTFTAHMTMIKKMVIHKNAIQEIRVDSLKSLGFSGPSWGYRISKNRKAFIIYDHIGVRIDYGDSKILLITIPTEDEEEVRQFLEENYGDKFGTD